MKLPLSILLIPALIFGQAQEPLSSSVKALLKKPRFGFAEITWRDGTHDQAQIVRVTDRFVAIQHRPIPACQNVDLSTIANIKWERLPNDGLGYDGFLFVLLTLPIMPFVGVKMAIRSHDSKLGSWESRTPPNQPSARLRFTDSWDHQGEGDVVEQEVAIRTGHYRFENGSCTQATTAPAMRPPPQPASNATS